MTGSISDQIALVDALSGYRRAERLAKWLGTMDGFRNEDARHHVLTHYALRCGYRPRDGYVTDWAERRVALIRRTFPNNVEASRD